MQSQQGNDAAPAAPTTMGAWSRPLQSTLVDTSPAAPAKSPPVKLQFQVASKKPKQRKKSASSRPAQQGNNENGSVVQPSALPLSVELKASAIAGSSALSFAHNKIVVVDSGGILRDMKLEKYGNAFVTVPDVIREIRNSKARQALASLPYEIALREPSSEAIAFVSNFSKKTGDFGVLSMTDLKVIALAYQLEREFHGTQNLRPAPKKIVIKGFVKGAIQPDPVLQAQYEEYKERNRRHHFPVATEDPDMPEHIIEKLDISDPPTPQSQSSAVAISQHGENVVESSTPIPTQSNASEDVVPQYSYEDYVDESEFDRLVDQHLVENTQTDSETTDASETATVQSHTTQADNCDHGDEWISPENIDIYRAKHYDGVADVNNEFWDDDPQQPPTENPPQDSKALTTAAMRTTTTTTMTTVSCPEAALNNSDNQNRQVGCVTTDFAMQNVLLQMGVQVISVSGIRIKQLRQWVKRCHACGAVINNTSRIYCPSCGNSTMLRVACSVDNDGNIAYYYNPRHHINLRGTKFPLPRPTGGRRRVDPILSEDMLPGFGNRHAVRQDPHKQFMDKLADPDFSFASLGNTAVGPGGGFVSRSNSYGRTSRNARTNGYGRRNPNQVVLNGKAAKNKKKQN